jgi:hypothetical protein
MIMLHPEQMLDITGVLWVSKDVQKHCLYSRTKFILPEICNCVSGTTWHKSRMSYCWVCVCVSGTPKTVDSVQLQKVITTDKHFIAH